MCIEERINKWKNGEIERIELLHSINFSQEYHNLVKDLNSVYCEPDEIAQLLLEKGYESELKEHACYNLLNQKENISVKQRYLYAYNLLFFLKKGINPKIANAYRQNLRAKHIHDFIKNGIDAKIVNSYPQKFDGYEIIMFINNDVSSTDIKLYDLIGEYKVKQIIELKNKKITYADLLFYDFVFNSEDRYHLAINNISNETALNYFDFLEKYGYFDNDHKSRLIEHKGETISILANHDLDLFLALKYPHVFFARDIVRLMELGITPEYTESYIKTKPILSKVKIDKNNPNFQELDNLIFYKQKYKGWEIIRLIEAGCPAEELDKYYERFKGSEIAVLYRIGLRQNNGFDVSSKKFYRMAKNMLNFKDLFRHRDLYSVLGFGEDGLVLLKNDHGKKSAWKYSLRINKEYYLLKKVKKHRNIVRCEAKASKSNLIKIEYINGYSLDQILKENNKLQKMQCIKYGYDILIGLIDLRSSGISMHNDIRPANILIDYENDRAVIIDLSIATEKEKTRYGKNRRFGGRNDLHSLGQIIYKMYIGRNLFNIDDTKSSTKNADKIKNIRMHYLRSKNTLEDKLIEIKKTINDDSIFNIIKTCLSAKGHDENFISLKRIFLEYLKEL